jgi:hypothetical protein
MTSEKAEIRHSETINYVVTASLHSIAIALVNSQLITLEPSQIVAQHQPPKIARSLGTYLYYSSKLFEVTHTPSATAESQHTIYVP